MLGFMNKCRLITLTVCLAEYCSGGRQIRQPFPVYYLIVGRSNNKLSNILHLEMPSKTGYIGRVLWANRTQYPGEFPFQWVFRSCPEGNFMIRI